MCRQGLEARLSPSQCSSVRGDTVDSSVCNANETQREIRYVESFYTAARNSDDHKITNDVGRSRSRHPNAESRFREISEDSEGASLPAKSTKFDEDIGVMCAPQHHRLI